MAGPCRGGEEGGTLGFSYRFEVQQGTLVWMSSARKTGCGCAEDCNGTDTLECVAFRIRVQGQTMHSSVPFTCCTHWMHYLRPPPALLS